MTEEHKDSKGLPKIHHIGVVVRNIEKAIEYYASNFGLGPFRKIESSRKNALKRGKPIDYRLIQAFAPMGEAYFELTEVINGKPLQAEFLDMKGEGVHHLGFVVDDLDSELSKYRKQGFNVLQSYSPSQSEVCFAFISADTIGGVVFELVQMPKQVKDSLD